MRKSARESNACSPNAHSMVSRDCHFSLYRLDGVLSSTFVSGRHGLWFDGDPYTIDLQPNELVIELQDSSIDVDIHNRRHILRYLTVSGGTKRIDPIGFS